MSVGYSLHIAGTGLFTADFERASARMQNLAGARDFSATSVEPEANAIEERVAHIAKAMNETKDGVFLITYTGHGTPFVSCSEFADGQGWVLENLFNFHETSIKRLLVGKFAPGVRVIWISDSCYSEKLNDEWKRRLLRAYRKRLQSLDWGDFMKSIEDDGLQEFRAPLASHQKICMATSLASDPTCDYIHISAGPALVVPGHLTNSICDLFEPAGDLAPPASYRELESRLQQGPVPTARITGSEPLRDIPAITP